MSRTLKTDKCLKWCRTDTSYSIYSLKGLQQQLTQASHNICKCFHGLSDARLMHCDDTFPSFFSLNYVKIRTRSTKPWGHQTHSFIHGKSQPLHTEDITYNAFSAFRLYLLTLCQVVMQCGFHVSAI